eukprot:TRINITY_DN7590_c0_g2_i1.p1 TRINITY_DN7590_c0_g2~~TRINITY_DN7590_c0_g2_i1.p1  ORF type:complete len:237 (-),score=68.85 TRINITY_DN7590_c0_g2_i1:143-853(-)
MVIRVVEHDSKLITFEEVDAQVLYCLERANAHQGWIEKIDLTVGELSEWAVYGLDAGCPTKLVKPRLRDEAGEGDLGEASKWLSLDRHAFVKAVLGLSWKQLLNNDQFSHDIHPLANAYSSPENYMTIWIPFLWEEIRAGIVSVMSSMDDRCYQGQLISRPKIGAYSHSNVVLLLVKIEGAAALKAVDLVPTSVVVVSYQPFDAERDEISQERQETFVIGLVTKKDATGDDIMTRQ